MKIIILGSKGNLGQQLVEVFSQKAENEIIAWDRGEVDITDRDLIYKKIKELKPELIINAAAYNSVDKCETSEEEYDLAKKANIDGPKFLAEAALEVGAIFVHYSSDYVFDGESKMGYKETDEPRPINRYGKTKFHGEKRILEQSGNGLKFYLIRTSKLFGTLAESEAAKPSFFDIMLKLAKEKKEIEVVNSEVSCFTYTPDLARATETLLSKDNSFGIYHITNRGSCTWYEAALELFKIAGVNIKVNPISGDKMARPAKRPKYSVLLNTKLEPLRDYREALKEYLGKCIVNHEL